LSLASPSALLSSIWAWIFKLLRNSRINSEETIRQAV
jgi:hypothetical protein